jgi:hypothetical protein
METEKQQNLYKYYESLFKNQNKENLFTKNLLLNQQITKLSELYSLTTKAYEPLIIENIITMRKYKVVPNIKNYLFELFIKNHFYISELLNNEESDFKVNNEISQVEIKDFILNSFYSCLNENSIKKIPENKVKSNRELIENTCVKERLTFYNYLLENTNMSKLEIKKYINKKYIEKLLWSNEVPDNNYEKKNICSLLKNI